MARSLGARLRDLAWLPPARPARLRFSLAALSLWPELTPALWGTVGSWAATVTGAHRMGPRKRWWEGAHSVSGQRSRGRCPPSELWEG